MAGVYPDVPGPRMAYDLDGSVGFHIDHNNAITQLTLPELQAMADEANTNVTKVGTGTAGNVIHFIGVIFPQLRDIVGYQVTLSLAGSGGGGPALDIETSVDTTNGFDGTWVRRVTGAGWRTTVNPDYRTQIVSVSYTGVKAFRLRMYSGIISNPNYIVYTLHLYGSLVAGQTPDRLRVWHPTLDQEVPGSHFDFGDCPRLSVTTKQFRIKNNSTTLTANAPALTFAVLTDASPTLVGQFQLSTNGTTYASSATLGNLAPGAISPVTYLRNTVSSTAALSLWSGRIKASASSWT